MTDLPPPNRPLPVAPESSIGRRSGGRGRKRTMKTDYGHAKYVYLMGGQWMGLLRPGVLGVALIAVATAAVSCVIDGVRDYLAEDAS